MALDDSTTALRLGLDVLLHLRNTQNRRLDPFLKAGPSVTFYGDEMENGKTQAGIFGGAGIYYGAYFGSGVGGVADLHTFKPQGKFFNKPVYY